MPHMPPTPIPHKIAMIVAMDAVNGIGKNGTLPWHSPHDLARFAKITKGTRPFQNAVIMGRKTWDSLPVKPLRNRISIVLSRNATSQDLGDHDRDHTFVASSVQEALDLLISLKPVETYVIGGAEVFKAFAPVTDLVYLTRIPGTHDCDTFWPAELKLYQVGPTEKGPDGEEYCECLLQTEA